MAPVAVPDRDADRPDRLVLRAPAGAGDAGDADADLGPEARGDALGQRLATSVETAPVRSISAGSTPARSILASFEYTTAPPRK